MDKKYIYFGLGLVAVGGLAYYFMSGNKGGAKSLGSGSSSSDTPLTDGANSTPPIEQASDLDSTLGGVPASRKQVRKECRKYAKDTCGRGWGGGKVKCRKDKRRQCKAEGGYEDPNETEDFLGASGNSGFGCTTANGMVGRWTNVPQGTSPETYKRTCVSRGFSDR